VVEKAVEGVRNAEDGTKRAWDARMSGLRRLVSRRGQEPHGRCSALGGAGQVRLEKLWRESEAHERMNPFAKVSGGWRLREDREGGSETTTPRRDRATQ
jgi:hypothetical protein